MTELRIALVGRPGAGKSTASERIRARSNKPVVVLKLAAPLYSLQDTIYRVAGRPLAEPSQQDGVLLNFLGGHLRSINPRALFEDFERRVQSASAQDDDRVLVCDDARPVDIPHLSDLGFRVALIDAPDEMRRARLAARGDLRTGDEDHPTERGIEGVVPDVLIVNEGTLDELDAEVDRLLRIRDA